jgi:Bacterial transcriptional activator domain
MASAPLIDDLPSPPRGRAVTHFKSEQLSLRERLRGQLMLALYRARRQADALKAYRDARDYFVGELGLEPSKPLRELEHSMLRQDDSLDLDPAPSRPPLELKQVTPPQDPILELRPRSVLWQAERKRLILVSFAGVLLLLAATAAAFELAVGGDASTQLAPVVPNSVAVIDPHTNAVLGGIQVGYAPSSIAVGEDAVWVLNADDGTVSRIDPISRETSRTIAVGGQVTDLAVGGGAVWVVNASKNAVMRIDARANFAVQTIQLPMSGEWPPVSFGSGAHIGVGGGAVWVTRLLQHGFVWRINPKTNAVAATIRLPRGAGGDALAVGEDAVWVNGNGGVTRIDTTCYDKTLLSAVEPGGTSGITVSKHAVWVAGITSGSERDELWRIDPLGEYVTASIPVGAGPAGVAADGRSIWVASSVARTVSRVDLDTTDVAATIALAGLLERWPRAQAPSG